MEHNFDTVKKIGVRVEGLPRKKQEKEPEPGSDGDEIDLDGTCVLDASCDGANWADHIQAEAG